MNRPYTSYQQYFGDIFTEQLNLLGGDSIDFSELVIDWDDKGSYMDFLSTNLKGVEEWKVDTGKHYFDFFVKNRNKLGLSLVPAKTGGFRFRIKPPTLWPKTSLIENWTNTKEGR